MSERFIKFIPSSEAMYLLLQKGHAFRLLTIIAESARRYSGDPDGLEIGEALIGDWKKYGMTEQNYRTAKRILIQRQHLKITETNRTRKKSTTGVTTEGTRVKLLSTTVYDINADESNDRLNDCPTTAQRLPNDELRKKRKDISNDISNEEDARRDGAHPASPIRSKDLLIFNFDKWEFEGINEKDIADWRLMYPHIDLSVETLKASQWLKNNPSKSNKKHWRKYLTGWFGRANDSIENKKAYRAASGSAAQDRSTKDINGKPVTNAYEGKF